VQQAAGAQEPLFGALDVRHAQICPQNPGRLTEETAAALRQAFPDTQFRLHANAHVEGWSARADASTYPLFALYFSALAKVSGALRAPAYTWHAGMRASASLGDVFHHTRALEDALGIPVGVEGLYPTADDRYLLSTWEEYRALLESNVRYALDMSHINILAHRSGRREDGLLRDLLASPACIEVHISGNAGDADTHGQLATAPWWWSFMDEINPSAAVFTEGGQVRPVYF
jgi:hypothetical protein